MLARLSGKEDGRDKVLAGPKGENGREKTGCWQGIHQEDRKNRVLVESSSKEGGKERILAESKNGKK